MKKIVYPCPFEQLGLKSVNVFYLPLKDKNGLLLDKSLRVVENSQLYKKLLNDRNELPIYIII